MRKLVAGATAAGFLGVGLLAAPSASADTDAAPVDIVFAFDTTGSMGFYIDNAREAAQSVAEEILGDNPEARIGLLEYRDAGDAFVARPVVPLSGDFANLTKGLDGLVASGGGDWPEAVFTGIYMSAMEFDFRSSANRSIVVIGDAPAHNPDKQTGLTDVDITNLLTGKSIELTEEQQAGYELAQGVTGASMSLLIDPESGEEVEPTALPTDGEGESTEPAETDEPAVSETAEADPATEETGDTEDSSVESDVEEDTSASDDADAETSATEEAEISTLAAEETITVGPIDPISLYTVTDMSDLADQMEGLVGLTGGKVVNMENADELGAALGEAIGHTASAPSANLSAISPVLTGVPVPVSAATTTGGTGELTYAFSVTNAAGEVVAAADSAEEVLSVTFETAGIYEATVTVTDEDSRTSTTTTTIQVIDAPAALEDATDFEVTANASVEAGSNLDVGIVGTDPAVFFLFADEAAFLAGTSAAAGVFPANWETEGLPIPGDLAAGSYLMLVVGEDGTLGYTIIEVTAPVVEEEETPTPTPTPEDTETPAGDIGEDPSTMEDAETTTGTAGSGTDSGKGSGSGLATTGLQNGALVAGGILMLLLGFAAFRFGNSAKRAARRK